MAKKVQEILVDDLDGSPAKETVHFGLDSRFYSIDLSEANAKELRDTLKKYVRKAEAVPPPSPQNEAKKIREWAVSHGYTVAKRGRLHRDIVEAYRNAKKR
ncbi:histone-like nucleoid-structuring protein Lsr2 [Nesterenkonia natronophila]|uniref:Lsr2 family protein n=1 Tax=Nesterenkonia natronophila TaxID=2174932 RepID=A0A3A4F1B1_9MICC|nr:Lsr2 family protein [Nesterenkonia natronophila]RJN31626.1 Lsr2 family protein [Nesterenkonia natronophila]